MIICLYHGSTFKNINLEQTNPITQKVKSIFEEDVYEAYYSKHVCETLKRRENIDMSLENILKENYNKYNSISILATNMIDGEEFNNIKEIIKKFDTDKKIKMTNPLLHKDNIESLSQAILNIKHVIINVGHGSDNLVKEYKQLNDILNKNNNYVTTLKDDFSQFLSNNIEQKNIILQPLMFTSGYHVKIDIEQKLVQKAEELGYEVEVQPAGLCKNKKVVDMLISNLKNL